MHRYERWWFSQIEKGGLSFCAPLAALYGGAVALRNWLYDHHHLPLYRAPLPVVSVGNPMVGGGGKTPLVCELVRLVGEQRRVAILTRGYRSRAERKAKPILVTQELSWEEVGDEALLLSHKCPRALV